MVSIGGECLVTSSLEYITPSVEKEFFSECPSSLLSIEKEYVLGLKEFVSQHAKNGTRVALITSGGTIVPLEKNTVRFLDNFSGGGRGSASAEYFIEQGYAVIFMHRKNSLQPYQRHFLLLKDDNFLDFLTWDSVKEALHVKSDNEKIQRMLQKYEMANKEKKLFKISFQTIHEYLYLLKECCTAMSDLKENALIYAAAAVSDFYLPDNQMAEHKIQSINGPLHLELQPVPKMLGILRRSWVPNAFVISFKLETDAALLNSKATTSLTRYKHQVVIGNLLQNHKNEVFIYQPDTTEVKKITKTDEEIANNVDIEMHIIRQVESLHSSFIQKLEQ